ncbi:MAG: DUF4982 domain-containing protein [Bacteroidales bacterium]|nr:DUF4982 domain-containing protein [Bacteroidales bacterium]
MIYRRFIAAGVAILLGGCAFAQRYAQLLEDGWKFHRGDVPEASSALFDDSSWDNVTVPHDWAIYGPFSREHDLQNVAVTQNLETKASLKTGRTGGLPYTGTGWYRRVFDVRPGKRAILLFDGAMSEAHVYVNGKEVCFWPYGYNAFHCDVTDALNPDGKDNILAVRLENKPFSSRWYPGAGLYRNVHLIEVNPVHIPVWGTYVTTPHVSAEFASVHVEMQVEGLPDGLPLRAMTKVFGPSGDCVAEKIFSGALSHGLPVEQNFIIESPLLWSPETPFLYRAVTDIYLSDDKVDTYETRFGIRSIGFVPEKGFYLNGVHRKFQGVCNHHDLGPLGAAVNVAALRRQLTLLKDMGCDAIRTSHNMPAPELVDLCDEMGLMMMIEPFDEWDMAKCENGYHRFFNETAPDGRTWAEKDMVNMLHHWRNSPSVVMWSIGNEVPTQCSPDGYKVARFLQDICHREDPSRKVTCGMDQVTCVLENGFASMVDIPGLNYRTFRYREAYDRLPQGFILGSETASAVSSRGVYKLPAEKRLGYRYDDNQCSSYDLEACAWANIPDVDFALADDYGWTLGQFVWTGFDYLGEPSPYDKDSWPNHSSMFGIIDLASIPKDRYYLYRSVWNRTSHTLHILPHWNWKGHEGKEVPVCVYTDFPETELFVNGVSYGRRRKSPAGYDADGKYIGLTEGGQLEGVEGRYRLMWRDAVYQPGEVRVVAYDGDGNAVAEKSVCTAGRPHHIELSADRNEIAADGKDLAYITVKVVDKDGNLCPLDGREVSFSVSGAGTFRAAANGDPKCLDLFHGGNMHAFNGMLTAIVQSSGDSGELVLTAAAKGLKPASLSISVK